METDSYDPRYLDGIREFNRRDFFEAHEAWEDLWLDCEDASRRFYQGLIQVAVCLHHFGNGNTQGARKLYHSGSSYLRAYGPRHLGLDIERMITQLRQCCDAILEGENAPSVRMDPALIPEIHLDPPLGDESADPGVPIRRILSTSSERKG